MTILRRPLWSGDGHAARGWHMFGHGDQRVRVTEAWEHENFAEEQARWERSDPEYARICEQARQARKSGGEASVRADEAKLGWDARVATQRQANDDAQRARHALNPGQAARRRPATDFVPAAEGSIGKKRSDAVLFIGAREGQHHMRTTFAAEFNDSTAPGVMPEPARVHDEPAAMIARRAAGRTSSVFLWPATRNPVSNEPTNLEVK